MPPPPPPPPPPGSLGKKRPENVDANAGKDGPTPNCIVQRSPTSQRPRSAGSGLDSAAATAEQKRRLKQLHWDKLKQAREGTVWSRANRDKLHLDLAQLESLFQVGGSAGWRVGGRRWMRVGEVCGPVCLWVVGSPGEKPQAWSAKCSLLLSRPLPACLPPPKHTQTHPPARPPPPTPTHTDHGGQGHQAGWAQGRRGARPPLRAGICLSVGGSNASSVPWQRALSCRALATHSNSHLPSLPPAAAALATAPAGAPGGTPPRAQHPH